MFVLCSSLSMEKTLSLAGCSAYSDVVLDAVTLMIPPSGDVIINN